MQWYFYNDFTEVLFMVIKIKTEDIYMSISQDIHLSDVFFYYFSSGKETYIFIYVYICLCVPRTMLEGYTAYIKLITSGGGGVILETLEQGDATVFPLFILEIFHLLKEHDRTSLVAQWLRIRLPVQGTRVQSLVWEDPTCPGATKPVRHNY